MIIELDNTQHPARRQYTVQNLCELTLNKWIHLSLHYENLQIKEKTSFQHIRVLMANIGRILEGSNVLQ